MGLDLSLVIPAYNEEGRLRSTLDQTVNYLKSQPWSCELIVVDDGSYDQTASLLDSYRSSAIPLQKIHNEINQGKGYSVRRGVLAAGGDIVMFMDADLATPLREIPALIGPIQQGLCDLAFGSRVHPGSRITRRQNLMRQTMGKTFNLILRLVHLSSFHDTQCGFKAFRRAVGQELFQDLMVDRFAFDVEILVKAKMAGYRVLEIPIEWYHQDRSTVSPVTDAARMFFDVLRVTWMCRRQKHARLPACDLGHKISQSKRG